MNTLYAVTFLTSVWIVIHVRAEISQRKLQGCRIPENFDHGFLYFEDTTQDNEGHHWITEDQIVEFECNLGYKLVGNGKIICLGQPNWEAAFPKCYKKYCNNPVKVEGGEWKGRRRAIHSVIRLHCLDGYKLEDPEVDRQRCTRVNETELDWTGPKPVCRKLKVCPDPGILPIGSGFRATTNQILYEGTEVSYNCNEEFEMVGNPTLRCEGDGEWNLPRPRCKPNVTCPDISPDPNGELSVSPTNQSWDFFVPGTLVELKCNWGFKPVKSTDLIYCEDDGEWDFPMARCERTACLAPDHPVNGFFVQEDLRDLYELGTEIRVRCNHGYRIFGMDWIRCTGSGWSRQSSDCTEITCRDPGVPEYGSCRGHSSRFPINSTVTCSCQEGYTLAGSVNRTCLTNGQWDGTPTTCTQSGSDGCPNPGKPMNGFRIGERYGIGDRVQFGCDPGFLLIGSSEWRCQWNGQWNGSYVYCRGKNDFDRPNDIKIRLLNNLDTKLALKDSERENSTSHDYGSSDGMAARLLDLSVRSVGGHLSFYFVFDSSDSVGKANFNTSIKFAKALVKRIGVSPTVHVGAVSYGKTAQRILSPLGKDSEEYVLRELSKAKYIGGGTAAQAALTEVRGMISLVRGNFPPGTNIKSIIFLITDGVYNIGGNPESIAKMLKLLGVEIYVMGIVGDQKKLNAKSLVSIASKPENVFYMNKFETLEYLVDVLVKDEIDYSRCGISVRTVPEEEEEFPIVGKILGGRPSVIHWPWMASLSIIKNGKPKRCGGSIIDNEWVLTAAHCLDGIKERDITVTVGVLNLIKDVKGDRQEFDVAKYWKHHLYNNMSKYDYDVAILKLKRPVKYGKYVRRICLTPEYSEIGANSFLYRPGEEAAVIGFGKTELGKASNELKEVDVLLQNRTTCETSLTGTVTGKMTARMICAGNQEGGKDAAEGDSGGPLMQELGERTGHEEPYWVQIGIVSWGELGKEGVKGHYGFYTHVARVKKWIMEVMEGKYN